MNIDVLQTGTIVLLILVAAGWYLSYAAARLDRLHAKVEGALSVLDAQIVRRAEAAAELAAAGVFDPATTLLLADAAGESLERVDVQPAQITALTAQTFAGRAEIESGLSQVLRTALTEPVVNQIRADLDSPGADALARLEASAVRVQMARGFHNEAVREVVRVRRKWYTRLFRLAGYASMPSPVEFDDQLPTDGAGCR